jgi:hypothetical protein
LRQKEKERDAERFWDRGDERAENGDREREREVEEEEETRKKKLTRPNGFE